VRTHLTYADDQGHVCYALQWPPTLTPLIIIQLNLWLCCIPLQSESRADKKWNELMNKRANECE